MDIRAEAARYYDSQPDPFEDVPFYRDRIPSPESTVLELGCGTGRVLLPLSQNCRSIVGIDCSGAMLDICRHKLQDAGIAPTRANVVEGDISNFDLHQTFDLVIAPFRVFQNLETDEQIDGLFRGLRRHLSPGGSAILNVYHPFRDAEGMRQHWCSDDEQLDWEHPVEGGRLTCHDRRPRIDPDRQITYPELIFRRYTGNDLVEESTLRIVMRYYYPDAFEDLIRSHGFKILDHWGGYEGEPYGQGSELVVQFG